MSTTVKNLAAKVVQLPPADRVYLAEQLLASLDDSDLEEQWMEEVKRRRDEIRSGKVEPLSSEEVYRRIDELLAE